MDWKETVFHLSRNGKQEKPDADNIAKIILDSLNGLAYKDDSQVSALLVLKDYGLEDKVIVELEEID